MNRITLTLALAVLGMGIGQTESFGQTSIAWLRSAQQAADIASKSGKPILVYVRSASCHYCDLMQSNVWEDLATAEIINRSYVPLKLTREENAEAVRSLKIKGFPTTLLFSADRKYLHRIDGYMEGPRFLGEMQKAVHSAGGLMSRR